MTESKAVKVITRSEDLVEIARSYPNDEAMAIWAVGAYLLREIIEPYEERIKQAVTKLGEVEVKIWQAANKSLEQEGKLRTLLIKMTELTGGTEQAIKEDREIKLTGIIHGWIACFAGEPPSDWKKIVANLLVDSRDAVKEAKP